MINEQKDLPSFSQSLGSIWISFSERNLKKTICFRVFPSFTRRHFQYFLQYFVSIKNYLRQLFHVLSENMGLFSLIQFVYCCLVTSRNWVSFNYNKCNEIKKITTLKDNFINILHSYLNRNVSDDLKLLATIRLRTANRYESFKT